MAPKNAPPADEATVTVNVEELRNSKDQVLMRLMAIQSYIADLSKSYLEHANNVINGSSATIDIPPVPTLPHGLEFAAPHSPGARSEAGEKKRKRRVHDPNAPKRALTPYFLYMQNNRQKIAEDLGSDTKPKDVSEEGTRRWQEMPAAQKEVWRQMYNANYEKYKVAMADYKAGKPHPGDEDHDQAASQLQNDIEAENQQDSDDQSSDDGNKSDGNDSDDASPSPAPAPKEKTPPPSGNKRRRSTGKNTKAAADVSPVKQSSPQKKVKKNEPASAKAVPESTGKRKGGKKRKSEA